jgi:polar amino acid transport system substrate-binding protein
VFVKRLAGAVVAVLIAAVGAAGLAGCGTKDNGGAIDVPPGASGTTVTLAAGSLKASVPPALAASGVLRVGTAFGRAPFESNASGQAVGIDVDLAESIGTLLGLKVTFVDLPITGLTDAVARHQVDVAMAGLADSAAARQAVSFVDYLRGAFSVLVPKGDPGHIRGPNDLCGTVPVGAVSGTPAATATMPCGQAHFQTSSTFAGALSQLRSGGTRAIVDDAFVVSYTAQTSVAPAELQASGSPFGSVLYGIAVARDTPAVRDAISGAMSALLRAGSYAQVLARWGAGSAAVASITVDGGS